MIDLKIFINYLSIIAIIANFLFTLDRLNI